jgi:hypothetical protein
MIVKNLKNTEGGPLQISHGKIQRFLKGNTHARQSFFFRKIRRST